MPISLSLEGKVALITGGSRGIGAATVRMFVEAGAQVLFNYEKAQAAAEKLVRECGDQNCAAVPCNLEGTKSAQELVAATVKRFGRLDILIANHGIWPADDVPIDKMSDDHWRRTLAINLDSVFALVKAFRDRDEEACQREISGAHCADQFDLGPEGRGFSHRLLGQQRRAHQLTKSLALEFARQHIYVNSVAPGWVDTDMSRPSLDDPAIAKEVLRPIPMGRVGTPEEIAGPILFLCTPHAGFITGEIFNVNGGAVLVG